MKTLVGILAYAFICFCIFWCTGRPYLSFMAWVMASVLWAIHCNEEQKKEKSDERINSLKP